MVGLSIVPFSTNNGPLAWIRLHRRAGKIRGIIVGGETAGKAFAPAGCGIGQAQPGDFVLVELIREDDRMVYGEIVVYAAIIDNKDPNIINDAPEPHFCANSIDEARALEVALRGSIARLVSSVPCVFCRRPSLTVSRLGVCPNDDCLVLACG